MLAKQLILPHALMDAADASPDAPAIVEVGGRRQTYSGLRDRMLHWAACFAAAGLRPGATVLSMLPNSIESYEVWLGAAWLGAVEVPVNTMYRGSMLAYVLNNSEAEIAVVAERYLSRFASICTEAEHLKTVVVPDATGDFPDLPFTVISGEEFLAGTAAGGDAGAGPQHFDIAAMIYTSGTTGPSKGVLVPWAELYQFTSLQPPGSFSAGRAYYSTYPSYHASGKWLLYLTICERGHLVIRETFSLAEFWNDVRAHDCQGTGLLGPMANLLMAAPCSPQDAENPLESVLIGPLIADVEGFSRRFGVRVATGFGMTEIGVPFVSDGFDLPNSRTCGRLRPGPPGYEARVVDEHDELVPSGTVGELIVRADEPWVLSAGYWKMPDKTAEAWRNGWFHTGDAFREDEAGNFYFVDRLKDTIRRRGENISSFEVEAGVNSHPAVLESAVVAVPSELGEDDVKAVIVLQPGASLEPAELIGFLIPRMPRFMIPRYVEVVDALPKTEATLRTRKMSLRPGALNSRTWDREQAGIVLPHTGVH